MLELITRPDGQVTDVDDAVLNSASHVNGILGSGCKVTVAGNKITVAAGSLLIQGRVVKFLSSESVTVTEDGILAVRIDFSAAPFVSLVTYPVGTALTQEDIFSGGQIYEQQLGKFVVADGSATYTQTIDIARCNLAAAPEKSRYDLGIHVRSTEPTNPKENDIWLW